MRVLNLYCGLGGNAALWSDEHDVVAIDSSRDIVEVYKENRPKDTYCCTDAKDYLLDAYGQFDFIWASPPCQTHSRMVRSGRNRKPQYVEMDLWQIILFLQTYFKGKWVVENVQPFYKPFIEPTAIIGRHWFWSNLNLDQIPDVPRPANFINKQNQQAKQELLDWLGIKCEPNIYYNGNHDPSQVIRNCVHPLIGKAILKRAHD